MSLCIVSNLEFLDHFLCLGAGWHMLHCKIRPTRTSYPPSIVSSSIWIWQLSCLFKQLRRLCRYCKTCLQAIDGKKKNGGQATSFLGVPWAAILSSPLKKEWQISPEKTRNPAQTSPVLLLSLSHQWQQRTKAKMPVPLSLSLSFSHRPAKRKKFSVTKNLHDAELDS
jgi:hypothetical protein